MASHCGEECLGMRARDACWKCLTGSYARLSRWKSHSLYAYGYTCHMFDSFRPLSYSCRIIPDCELVVQRGSAKRLNNLTRLAAKARQRPSTMSSRNQRHASHMAFQLKQSSKTRVKVELILLPLDCASESIEVHKLSSVFVRLHLALAFQ